MSTPNRTPLIGLLTAATVSRVGTRMSMIALPWFTLAITGSATRTGVVGFAEMLPFVLACGLGGPLIDRIGPRRMAVLADLTSGVLLTLVPVLYHLDRLDFGTLLALVAAVGLLRGLGDTAKRVVFPDTVTAAGMSMTRATSLYDGLDRLATLLGAAVSIPLLAAFDASVMLLVDAATFGAAALIVTLTVPALTSGDERTTDDRQPSGDERTTGGRRTARDQRAPTEPAPGGESYLAALRAGLRYLRQDRLILGIVVMLFVTNLADAAYQTVLAPVWAKEGAGTGTALGLLFGSFGLGAVLGNVVFTALAPKLPRFAVFAVGFLVAGAPRFLALTLDDAQWLVYSVSFLAGLSVAAINPILGAASYERIPERFRARVLGLTQAIAWAGIPLGGLLAGLAVDHLLLPVACLLFGAAYLVVTLLPFVGRSWRELDRAPDEDDLPAGPAGRSTVPSSRSADDRERPTEQGQGGGSHREQGQQLPTALSAGDGRGGGRQRG